jgi:hypothetical protein
MGFFLIMKMAGLAQITELRALNAVIMFSGVYLAIRNFKKQNFNVDFSYLSGITMGFFTGLVVAITFSLFVGIYLAIDGAFLEAIMVNNAQQRFMNPLTIAVVIFIEALASGMLFSFISMQYLKPSYSPVM